MNENAMIAESDRIITSVKIGTGSGAVVLRSDHGATIAGMRGKGKTTLTMHILSKMPNCFIYDPLDQYGALNIQRYVPMYDTMAEFENVCHSIWLHGNVLFAIEEAELYLPERKELTPYAKRIILRGRNRGIGFMAITRRIAMLNKTAFSLSDHVFLYPFFSKNDIDYCREFIGSESAAALRTLKKYYFIYYRDGIAKTLPPVPEL